MNLLPMTNIMKSKYWSRVLYILRWAYESVGGSPYCSCSSTTKRTGYRKMSSWVLKKLRTHSISFFFNVRSELIDTFWNTWSRLITSLHHVTLETRGWFHDKEATIVTDPPHRIQSWLVSEETVSNRVLGCKKCAVCGLHIATSDSWLSYTVKHWTDK